MGASSRGRFIILPKDPTLAQAVLEKEFEAIQKAQGEGEAILSGETPSQEVESVEGPGSGQPGRPA